LSKYKVVGMATFKEDVLKETRNVKVFLCTPRRGMWMEVQQPHFLTWRLK